MYSSKYAIIWCFQYSIFSFWDFIMLWNLDILLSILLELKSKLRCHIAICGGQIFYFDYLTRMSYFKIVFNLAIWIPNIQCIDTNCLLLNVSLLLIVQFKILLRDLLMEWSVSSFDGMIHIIVTSILLCESNQWTMIRSMKPEHQSFICGHLIPSCHFACRALFR